MQRPPSAHPSEPAPQLTLSKADDASNVLGGWWDGMPGGSILLVWRHDDSPGRLGMQSLGLPVRTLADLDGVLLVNNL